MLLRLERHSEMMKTLPSTTGFVVIGAGFAGASTAWALGRGGHGPGVILEQEAGYGVHASGRNAAILRLVESDPVIRTLAAKSLKGMNVIEATSPTPFLRLSGGLSLAAEAEAAADLELQQREMADSGTPGQFITGEDARGRFPLLRHVHFMAALWCAQEGVVDIHELLTRYLHLAQDTGFPLFSSCPVERLLVEGGRVRGVETPSGTVRAEMVVDASGAWAGRLRPERRLPLQPLRRHLFVTGPPEGGHHDSPFAWIEDAGFYFRPEGDGLLMSPCDETAMEPCDPPVDQAAAELLADKIDRFAPGFSDLPVRRSWACLRTFTPDRRPVIGPDPQLEGLFHVSGLGGFGMTTSAAVGELAATLLTGRSADWIDASLVSPARF